MPGRALSPAASSRASTASTTVSRRRVNMDVGLDHSDGDGASRIGFAHATQRELLSLTAAPDGTAHSGLWWACSMVLQLVMYAAASWPRFASWTRADITIVHFMLVPFVTDGILLGMRKSHRHWASWFRIAVAAQIGTLTIQLALMRFDADPVHVAMSLGTCALVVVDSLLVLWTTMKFGQMDEQVFAFLKGWIRGVGGFAAGHGIITAAGFILLANLFANTHNMWGDTRLDGPLTGFQSGDAPAALLKLAILTAYVPSKWYLVVVNAAFFGALAVQWPIMPEMFFGARWPVLHIGAEIGLLYNTVMAAKAAAF